MKYIFTRIIILILLVVAVKYFSDSVAEHTEPAEYGYMEGAKTFFTLLFALAIISTGIFSYEAYRFHRQKKIKDRNKSLILISSVLLLVLIFSGYFFQFAF